MAFQWDVSEPVPIGVIRLLGEEADHAIAQLSDDTNDRDQAVHEARKSFKKIRAILRLVRYEIGEDVYQEQNAFYRDLGRMLAPLRDAFILNETMDHLMAELQDSAVRQVAHDIRVDLETTYQLSRSAFWESGEAVAQVLHELQQARPLIQAFPIERDSFKTFRKGLRRIYRQGQKQMDAAYEGIPSPDGFHAWRKRVKYLWYHMRILEPIKPEEMDILIGQLDELSDLLGLAHDLAVLYDRTASHPLTQHGAGRQLLAHLDYRRGQLETAAQPIGQSIYAQDEKSFANQIKKWWKASESLRA